MDRLIDLATVLRSKNSGPFSITLDILFDDKDSYDRVKNSKVLTREKITELYQLGQEDITEFVFYDQGLGIKITYDRRISSGTIGDRDVYGAQQHAPLFDIEIPEGSRADEKDAQNEN